MKFHDKKEQELMKSIETEEWVSVNNLEEEIEKAKKAAEATLIKSEMMNIPMHMLRIILFFFSTN